MRVCIHERRREWASLWVSPCYMLPYMGISISSIRSCTCPKRTWQMHFPIIPKDQSREHGQQPIRRNTPSGSIVQRSKRCGANAAAFPQPLDSLDLASLSFFPVTSKFCHKSCFSKRTPGLSPHVLQLREPLVYSGAHVWPSRVAVSSA